MPSTARGSTRLFLLCSWSLLVMHAACADEPSKMSDADPASATPTGVGPGESSDALYDPAHVVDVKITMDPADWQRILDEGRSVTTVYAGCDKGYDYTWAKASVTVDGITRDDVAVRKKGFLGSLSQVKPGLKVDFNRNVKGQTLWGVKGLTLNNDVQDLSHTHQCMAYGLFDAANSPAPRCNFAKVTVNGKEVGIYSNVETMREEFLARHFEDEEGNLYEGAGGADFDPVTLPKFELETNTKANDRADLDRVVEALKASDADLHRALGEVIDMDAFLTYWALESIMGHWDGYAGNQNNYFLYHHPKNQKFYFLPWGTDGAFHSEHVNFAPGSIPKSAYASSLLTYRLYANAETRALYQQRVRALLDEVWNEDALLREVDRIGALTSADPRALERQRQFIRTRKQTLLAEFDAGAPDWPYKPRKNAPDRPCLPTFAIEGRFETTWGDLNAGLVSSPGNSFRITDADKLTSPFPYDLHTAEINQPKVTTLASAGPDQGGPANPNAVPGTPTVWIVGVSGPAAMGANIVVSLSYERSRFGARELPFFALETYGVVVRSKGPAAGSQVLGYIGDGKTVFDEVGTGPGSRVRGSFTGVFVPTIFDQLK